MTTRLPRFTLVLAMPAVLVLGLVAPREARAAITYSFGTPTANQGATIVGGRPTITSPTGTVNIPIIINFGSAADVPAVGLKQFGVTLTPTWAAPATSTHLVRQGVTTGPYVIDSGAILGILPPSPPTGTVSLDVTLTNDGTNQICQHSTTSGQAVWILKIGTDLLSGTDLTQQLCLTTSDSPAPHRPFAKDCAAVNATGVGYSGPCQPIDIRLCDYTGTIQTLTATQLKDGNAAATPTPPPGIDRIQLSWTLLTPNNLCSDATLDIWRAPFGQNSAGTWVNLYPEYDDDNLFTAQAPPTPTGPAPPDPTVWTPVTGTGPGLQPPPLATSPTFVDIPPSRGYWYYVAAVHNPQGPANTISPMTGGTLDYLLADVNAGGDWMVNTNDGSALFSGGAYGKRDGDVGFDPKLDFAPTMDHSIDGRPHPDDFISFEEMMIYSMEFGKGSTPQFVGIPAAADHDELTLDAPAEVRSGETFAATLRFTGAGDIKGVSTQLGWDAGTVEPLSVRAGSEALAQGGMVLSTGPGDVDAAVVGRDRAGFSGQGELATVMFRAKADGHPGIGIATLDARDNSNRKVDLHTNAPASQLETAFGASGPNPFKLATTLGFSLGHPGPAELAIYSVDGRRVKTLTAGERGAGSYRLTWDGTDDSGHRVNPGMFYARLITREGRFGRTLILTR
jgi:hypothetical protein